MPAWRKSRCKHGALLKASMEAGAKPAWGMPPTQHGDPLHASIKKNSMLA